MVSKERKHTYCCNNAGNICIVNEVTGMLRNVKCQHDCPEEHNNHTYNRTNINLSPCFWSYFKISKVIAQHYEIKKTCAHQIDATQPFFHGKR